MDTPSTWQLVLRADPTTVFCSLVRAAGEEGRLCGVENYGTAVTYTPARRALDVVGQMRAAVRPCPAGALVTIAPAEARYATPDALALQERAVASLIHRLRRYYSPSMVEALSSPVGR